MKKPSLQAPSQRGGTLVGFVVGLLVGLGVALSVAIYVTRVPVPFVDRGVSRKPAQDVEEAERNKGWNPNAALTSKEAPAAPPAIPVADPATTPVTTPGAVNATPAAPPVAAPAAPVTPQVRTPGADPLGELAQARLGQAAPASTAAPAVKAAAGATAVPAVSSPAPADPFIYFVQAGAFRTPEDAEAQRAKLAILGIDAQISEREQSGRTVFRVRVGPFDQKTPADGMHDQLTNHGVEAALVRVQR